MSSGVNLIAQVHAASSNTAFEQTSYEMDTL